MAKRKVQVVPVLTPTTTIDSVSVDGEKYSVGTEVLVKHHSFGSWVSLVIKEIREERSGYTFFFFHNPPGWIAVSAERIKPLKKTRRKVRAGVSLD